MTVVRKYRSSAPRSRSTRSSPQSAAAKAIAGRHIRKRGRFENCAARMKISESFPNSDGCTDGPPDPNRIQFFAPFCQSPITSGAATARNVTTASGRTHLSQSRMCRIIPMPMPIATMPARM